MTSIENFTLQKSSSQTKSEPDSIDGGNGDDGVTVAVEYYNDLKNLKFNYPRYESPFPVLLNPNYSEWMKNYCCQWVIDMCHFNNNRKIKKLLNDCDLSLFPAFVFPTANWNRLEKFIKHCLLFFIVDDLHELDSTILDLNYKLEKPKNFWLKMLEMLDQLENSNQTSINKSEWPYLINAIFILMREIHFDYNDEQIKRSVNMIRDYIEGCLNESQWCPNNDIGSDVNYIPDWTSYIKTRTSSIGMQMSLQLIEYGSNVSLTKEQWNHSSIKKLMQLISKEIALVNDYLSFRKEVAENDFKFSRMRHSFTVLVNEGLDLQQAVNKIHQLILETDNQIKELIQKILLDPELNSKPESYKCLKKWLDGAKNKLGGNWRFSITARRYHGLDFLGAIPSNGYFIYDPQRTLIFPNDYYYQYDWYKPIPINIQPTIYEEMNDNDFNQTKIKL